jgi:hypothetical protein
LAAVVGVAVGVDYGSIGYNSKLVHDVFGRGSLFEKRRKR